MKKTIFLTLTLMSLASFTFAEESADNTAILSRLDKIESSQEKILEKLESISTEINIVKIRSTR